MSRSARKAIYKDKGFGKSDYWKVHRRVNKAINKHFFTSATHISIHYWLTDFDELYFETIRKYEDLGMTQEEAYYEAIYEHEDDWWYNRLVSNSCREWWETPEFKNPKQLVNDYDYCDYIVDEENDFSTFTFDLSVERREDRKETIAKMRRK